MSSSYQFILYSPFIILFLFCATHSRVDRGSLKQLKQYKDMTIKLTTFSDGGDRECLERTSASPIRLLGLVFRHKSCFDPDKMLT